MNRTHPLLRQALLALLLAAAAPAALAAPSGVALVPPDGARFLEHQRFDVRVEGSGAGPYSATIRLDGKPVQFTSGEQNTTTTDGISAAGWGGFNLRGLTLARPGFHDLEATFSDATGTVTVKHRVEVVGVDPPRRGRGKPEAKNVVILLGDGMGVAHRTAARLVRHGATNGDPNGYLAMDEFPGTGLVTTHSLNSIVTDSAPGMACYASGSHANNGQEGVYPAHMTSPFYFPRVEYMAEYLHRVKGTSLGLVTTADVEDATPAANAVHTGDRNQGTGICDQYLDESDWQGTGRFGTGLAVLLGGGRNWFKAATGEQYSRRTAASDYEALPADLVAAWGLPAAAAGAKDPDRDLVGDFVNQAKFTYVDNWSGAAPGSAATSLKNVMSGHKVPDRLLGLFGWGNMNVAVDKVSARRGGSADVVNAYHAPDQPMLDEMADAAFRVLSKNRNGFVLMIEGAHIDKQSHLMDTERAIGDTLEFDRAVKVARDWADRLGDTVVVVLADHECSGFSLPGALANVQSATNPDNVGGAEALKTQADLSPTKVVGTYESAGFPRYDILADGYPASYDIDKKLLVGYGASADRKETWLSKAVPVVDSLLPAAVKSELATAGYPASAQARSAGILIGGQAQSGTSSANNQAVHTAADIPVSAYSSGSDAWKRFVGVQRNTDVFFKLMKAALEDP
jgi:alkaline phosphatase